MGLREWARGLFKHAAPPVGDFLGKRLEEVQRTGFFTWFSLAETSRAQTDGRQTVVRFKPSGEKFHEVVTVELSLDRGEQVRAITLTLARAFADDPRDGVFARDIAKSLLRAAVAEAPPQELKTLADEIEFSHDYRIIVGPGYQPPPPQPEPSPGFLTYLGRRASYERSFPGFALRMENSNDGATPLLGISLRTD